MSFHFFSPLINCSKRYNVSVAWIDSKQKLLFVHAAKIIYFPGAVFTHRDCPGQRYSADFSTSNLPQVWKIHWLFFVRIFHKSGKVPRYFSCEFSTSLEKSPVIFRASFPYLKLFRRPIAFAIDSIDSICYCAFYQLTHKS